MLSQESTVTIIVALAVTQRATPPDTRPDSEAQGLDGIP